MTKAFFLEILMMPRYSGQVVLLVLHFRQSSSPPLPIILIWLSYSESVDDDKERIMAQGSVTNRVFRNSMAITAATLLI